MIRVPTVVTCQLTLLIAPSDAGYVEIEGTRLPAGTDATSVTCGSQLVVEARTIDAEKFGFLQWEGDFTGDSAEQTAIIESPTVARAVFVGVGSPTPTPTPTAAKISVTYQLIINGAVVTGDGITVDNGNMEVSPGPTEPDNGYVEGTLVILKPQPDANFVFQDWLGDCEGVGSCAVTMDSEKGAFATFIPLRYNVTASATEGGTVSPAGTTSYAPGEIAEIKAREDEGYRFVGWQGCSGLDEKVNCDFFMFADQFVTAIFTRQYTLTFKANPSDSGTISPGGTWIFDKGKVVRVTATAASGYAFVAWGGDCQGTSVCDVTIDGDGFVTANFELGGFALTTASDQQMAAQ